MVTGKFPGRRKLGEFQKLRRIRNLPQIRAFVANETGAVTSDWVVLTAGLVLVVWAGALAIRAESINSIVRIFTWVQEAGL